MNKLKKKYPRQDELTKEWFFNGKWYDDYPGQEANDYNSAYDGWMEQKFDEKRDEGKL
jgi:hypothetical protein